MWLFAGAGWLLTPGRKGVLPAPGARGAGGATEGMLSAPPSRRARRRVVWDSGQWRNAPVWPPVVFLSLGDIWCVAASSQKEALMEDVRVGRKELTLLLKGNRNGNVSDCF